MDPDGHPRQRERQQEGAVANRVLPDRVADVNDLRVTGDRQHHPAADRGRGVRPEVGEEADERARRRAGGLHRTAMVPVGARQSRRRPEEAGRRLGRASGGEESSARGEISGSRRRRWLAGRRARVGARGAIAVAADSARTSAAYAIRRWMMASTSGSDQRKPALGKPCRNAVRFAASPASRPRASRARYVALRLAATGRSCDSGWSSIDPAFRASQTVRPADPVGSVRGSSGRIGRVAMTHQYQARRYFLRAHL